MTDALPSPADSVRLLPLAAPLAVTQMIGWGTTFWLPAVMVGPLTRDLGIAPEAVFGGITVMLLVGAAAAPRFGRIIDRSGSRWPMACGSLVFAAALAVLSQATGLAGYVAAWMLIGLGTPLALTQAAAAAMSQLAGPRARQGIGLLMLLGGFSSSIFWPLSAFLDAQIGWRAMCLVFAALHVLVCVPIHLVALRPRASRDGDSAAPRPVATPSLAPERRRSAFTLMAVAFSLAGFVSWGLPLQIVEILKAYGHPVAFAIFAGSLMGPAQVISRLGEIVFGRSTGILTVGVVTSAIMPIAVVLPILSPASAGLATAFVIGYGMSAGAMTVVRSVAPLALFGKDAYATMTGWLTLPQNIVFALAPMAFAFVMRTAGPTATLAMSCGAALIALGTMAMLERRFRNDAVA
ncbi:MFS transporter [Phreatobacter oligotrophus]|uniref:Putative MFS family arabinose efflux permease n=1 Tax=Phreatobacter oligotrophus TaxID=1122261 RepID=A0A2T4ZIQ2_9HYPH|nr:MFS transporter [Phreatobacter oligotrophus]PTM61859.1 putative MFS family arabinose efflux permease [Phreatobacter oligotrophus]